MSHICQLLNKAVFKEAVIREVLESCVEPLIGKICCTVPHSNFGPE